MFWAIASAHNKMYICTSKIAAKSPIDPPEKAFKEEIQLKWPFSEIPGSNTVFVIEKERYVPMCSIFNVLKSCFPKIAFSKFQGFFQYYSNQSHRYICPLLRTLAINSP